MRSIRERLGDPLWWLEQAAHGGASWPGVFAGPWWGLLVGLWIGLQRELVEARKQAQRLERGWRGWLPQGTPEAFDLAADLVASTLGGALWGLLGRGST